MGWLLAGIGAMQLLPLLVALLFGEPALPYLASAATALVVGGSLLWGAQPEAPTLPALRALLPVF